MNHNPNRSPLTPLTARELISGIILSDEYLRERDRGVAGMGAIALSASRLAVNVAEANHGYETDQSRQLRLISALPKWLRAEHDLDTRRSGMTENDLNSSLESVIEFNHALREIIDNETYTKMSDVMRFVSETLLIARVKGPAIKYAAEQLQSVLDGMRHEVASESVLSSLPEVESVRGASSIEEERQGKDVIVTMIDGREIALDIKSTQRSADKANLERRGSDYRAVWSGFTWDDFGDELLPTDERLRSGEPHFRKILEGSRSHMSVAN